MEHLRDYIAGLNMAIAAGVDVRFMHHGRSVPAIGTIEINETDYCLDVWHRTPDSPCDQMAHPSVRTRFTTEFNDLPNDLREAGWK